MKKGKIYELEIVDADYPNLGIGYIEGQSMVLKGALPGQIVEATVSRKRDKKSKGKLRKVLKQAPNEIESFCEHFGKCGGCSFQTLSYEDQVNLKSTMVANLFKNASLHDFEYGGVLPSPEVFNYRNKMEYTFGDEEKDGEMELGMHKKGMFNSVVTVDKCHICDEDMNTILINTLDHFKKAEVPHYKKNRHEGILRHLVLRKGKKTGEILVALSANNVHSIDIEAFKDMLLSIELKGEIVGILVLDNTTKSDAVNGDVELIWGRDYYFEELLGLKFKVSFYSFFQTNTVGAELLYSTAIDYLGSIEGKEIFDLYTGTGTIAQLLSKKARKVTGIEIVEDAVIAAKENAKLNGIDNCHFIAGDVFVKLDELKNHKPDMIVVDPPREGILEKALHKIINFGAEEIVYVSCNPKTLVDNLVQFKKYGYKLEKAICVDMFPHTAHVETVVRLKKQ